jgi:hypothetical protein
VDETVLFDMKGEIKPVPPLHLNRLPLPSTWRYAQQVRDGFAADSRGDKANRADWAKR